MTDEIQRHRDLAHEAFVKGMSGNGTRLDWEDFGRHTSMASILGIHEEMRFGSGVRRWFRALRAVLFK